MFLAVFFLLWALIFEARISKSSCEGMESSSRVKRYNSLEPKSFLLFTAQITAEKFDFLFP